MPANYSCAVGEVRAGLTANVDLAAAAFGGGETFGVGDGFGGNGVSIAINSDTVTNLNPFASS